MSTSRPAISYITTCKARLAHLKQTLPRVASQPGVQCIVVDYDCPEGTAAWVTANFPNVTVAHVKDAPGFSVSRARNVGAKQAQAPWLAFFDADIILHENFFARVTPALKPGHYYRAHPLTRQTCGSVICAAADFAKIGGYDETYRGWGSEDDDLYINLKSIGVKRLGYASALISEIPHPDSARTRYHSIDMLTAYRINQTYMQIKLDIQRVTGVRPAQELRQRIYAAVTAKFQDMVRKNERQANFQIEIPSIKIGQPVTDAPPENQQLLMVRRQLNYVLSLQEAAPPAKTPAATTH